MRLDVPAVSYWAAVPHYVAQPPCPKATLALLGQIEELLEVQHPARRPARGRPRLGARRRRAGRGGRGRRATTSGRWRRPATPPSCPRPRGEAIAREFERYLKRRAEDGDRPARPDRDAPDPPSVSDDCRLRAQAEGGVEQRRMAAPASGSLVSASPAVPRVASDPGVDGRHRGRGVEVVGEGARARRRRPARPGRRRRARAPGATRSSGSTDVPRARRRSTPSRCGSGGAAGSAGSPSGRRRCCGARRRRPGCRATSTSSRRRRPTIPACT